MSDYYVVQDPSAKLWNSFWESYREGDFFQSFEYGEISKTASQRTKIARLSINLEENPIAMIQGTYTRYLGFGMTLQVLCGPVVSTEKRCDLQLVIRLLKELEDYCKRKRIILSDIWVLDSWQLREAFLNMGYASVGKINDYVVNLEGGVQRLWDSIHHNKRRNIKKAEREGVEIIQSHSHKDLEAFCLLHEASAKRDGFTPVPRSWFEAAWKIYSPELSQVVLAYWKGKSIAGVYVVIHRNTVYALRAGSRTEGLNVRPNELMHWKTMEWACENGYSKYNMGMVNEPVPTEKSDKWGIWRWKKEWNGSLERIEIFDKTILPRYKPVLQARDIVYDATKRFK
jgi:lipid II:glycine glycyltransferase (peptidoglycan interpeptide bridge formation enzyme)